MDNARLIKVLAGHYGKRLQRWWEERGLPRGEARDLRVTYAGRFAAAMDAADFGPDNGRFSSYLNCLSGVTAYAMARERGLSVEEGIACYDYLAKPLRGFSAWLWNTADLLPNAYRLIVGNIREDLTGPKGICWGTEVIRDDDEALEYRIHTCLYYDICREQGYPETIQLFCNHDHHAWDGLHRHVRFERHGGVGERRDDGSIADGLSSTEPGCLCHDSFVRVR